MRIGIDTGGTFTDFVLVDGDRVEITKIPSTPDDPGRAILTGLQRFPHAADAELVHGTTVATNALLQRRLARVTFVTNRGLEDVLEIGRQARPDLYAVDIVKPEPFVPASRRIGIDQRTGANGECVTPLDAEELARVVRRVAKSRPEAIAVGLVFSFLHPREERRIARALKEIGVPVSLSSGVAPEVREFERFSTTVANAGLIPVVSHYLGQLQRALRRRRLFVFRSNGGMARALRAAKSPIELVLSGPAGGTVGAARVATRLGLASCVALDMGGTSTDISLLRGAPLRRGEITLDGHPFLVPSLDIETVGAGGGSIAWVDATGRLRIGPQSAGASPGPACYGVGEEATVTDAHVVLGRLPSTLAGGSVELDVDRSHQAFDRLGKAIGKQRRQAAEGVLRVADATMARTARSVILSRGDDPRQLPLIAFGGAGPLHAARLIRVLPSPFAIIPRWPGNLSAYGMALADPERDLVQSILLRDPDQNQNVVKRVVKELTERGRADLIKDGFDSGIRALQVEPTLDCRYVGQSYTLSVPVARGIKTLFDGEHAKQFGHAFPDRAIELVNIRVRLVVGTRPHDVAPTRRTRNRPPPSDARIGTTDAWFHGDRHDTPTYDRESLPPGTTLVGPARIEELSATTLLDPGNRATIDADRNLEIRPT